LFPRQENVILRPSTRRLLARFASAYVTDCVCSRHNLDSSINKRSVTVIYLITDVSPSGAKISAVELLIGGISGGIHFGAAA
jgi:hypothetical protein